MRRSLKSIHYRRAESLRGNSFCNDQVEAECIELAQVTKQIRRRFPQVSSVA
jgi:hypothetical protein